MSCEALADTQLFSLVNFQERDDLNILMCTFMRVSWYSRLPVVMTKWWSSLTKITSLERVVTQYSLQAVLLLRAPKKLEPLAGLSEIVTFTTRIPLSSTARRTLGIVTMPPSSYPHSISLMIRKSALISPATLLMSSPTSLLARKQVGTATLTPRFIWVTVLSRPPPCQVLSPLMLLKKHRLIQS